MEKGNNWREELSYTFEVEFKDEIKKDPEELEGLMGRLYQFIDKTAKAAYIAGHLEGTMDAFEAIPDNMIFNKAMYEIEAEVDAFYAERKYLKWRNG